MKNFVKSAMTVDGQTVRMSMPFAKVDKDARTVSGYATLDNLDTQGDIVLAEASANAFARARGNLREMHDKIAVGRVIDWQEEEFVHNGDIHRAIFVTAYISKGAPDTWEKVLDGTLSGFSIGGEINDASSEFVKEAGRTVRFIKDYDLTELSLVDNPANQLANVVSIQKSLFTIEKSASGSVTVEGLVAETVIENVFVCNADDTIIVKVAESADCPVCGLKMENAGWFESGPDRTEKVRAIVSKFLSPVAEEAAPTSEGGVDMGRKVTKSESVSEESTETPDAVDATEEDALEDADREQSEVVEEETETAEVTEVEDEEETISKKIDELKVTINEALEKTHSETTERVASLEAKIDEINKSFETKASELESKLNGFGEKLEAAKGRLQEFEKALEIVNASDAVKKSADLEGPAVVQKAKRSEWTPGTFSLF